MSCDTLPGLGLCTYISFPLGHIFKCPAQRLLAYWTVQSRRVSSSQRVQGIVTALFTRTRGCILLIPVSPIHHCAWLAMNVQWTFAQRTRQVTASLIIIGECFLILIFFYFFIFSVSITNSVPLISAFSSLVTGQCPKEATVGKAGLISGVRNKQKLLGLSILASLYIR